MSLICPTCRGALVPIGDDLLQCDLHAEHKCRVFFARPGLLQEVPAGATAAPPAALAADSRCVAHPELRARYTCAGCGQALCVQCGLESGGQRWCSTCMPVAHVTDASPAASLGDTTYCTRHPEVAARYRCNLCHDPICGTCSFDFPGGYHVCPTCASKPQKKMTGGRLALVIGGYGIFLLTIVMFGLAMAAAAEERAASEALSVVSVLLCLGGLACAISSLDRNRGNTPVIWIGVVLNVLLASLLGVMVVIGLFTGG